MPSHDVKDSKRQFAEVIYRSLENLGLQYEDQKGCGKGTAGSMMLLFINDIFERKKKRKKRQ